jgi:hypothetical protein
MLRAFGTCAGVISPELAEGTKMSVTPLPKLEQEAALCGYPTLIKKDKIVLNYKEIQKGAVAESYMYMKKGFL